MDIPECGVVGGLCKLARLSVAKLFKALRKRLGDDDRYFGLRRPLILAE